MHQRQTRWAPLGELRGSDADFSTLTYRFSHATCGFAASNDDWLRIALSLEDGDADGGEGGAVSEDADSDAPDGLAGAVSDGAGGSVEMGAETGAETGAERRAAGEKSGAAGRAPARRSWALDPGSDARRTWRLVDMDVPFLFSDRRSYRYAAGNEGVEGTANPHEDSRGIVPVEVGGNRFVLPVTGKTDAAAGFAISDRHIGDESGPAPVLDEVELSRCRDGVLLSFPLPEGCVVYGLGEKTGGLDKRGRSWVMWNSDEPRHTPGRDPLYQSIPVAYIVTAGGTATLFVDATATMWFDVGESVSDRLQVEVYDDEVTFYLRHDPSLPEAVAAYSALTGRIALPPEWALGFQQCRYSYFPDSRVLEVAERMRELNVPCDVIYLDIHYMDGYRVFTWDPVRFPEPKTMIEKLHERGFRVVTIVDPGVKYDPDYHVFADGLTKDVFLEDPGKGPYVGTVWPGEAVFPDFTEGRVRRWWAEHHQPLLDAGVAGIWNDMNEPADFSGSEEYRPDFTVPDRLIARNEGRPKTIARVHNIYGNGMNAATREAMERYRPDERGFVLTRSGYAGVQRYAAVWTGDNHSWWEHIRLMIPMLSNLGLSGVPFCGGDVGGFQMNADGELYARWVAAAALTPFFRAHSALDTVDHEPWSFGDEVLAAARRFIGLRYRLMPYLYTLFEEASRTGAPVIRPLVWEFPYDPRVFRRADSYMVGPALLVAPVVEPGVQERAVYLPEGVWYDFWTGRRYDAGSLAEAGRGQVVACDAPLDRIPIFVRGGHIVPFEGLRQHTGEPGDGVLRLLVAPDAHGHAAGSVYGDGGEGFGYRKGEFWRARFAWRSPQGSRQESSHGENVRVGEAGRDGSGKGMVSGTGLVTADEEGELRWTRWERCEPVVITDEPRHGGSIADLLTL